LPPRIRALYVVGRERMAAWLAEALSADSASQVLLDEAVGPATGLAALGERIYDVILVGHAPGELDAIEFVEGLRAGGAEEPIIILGDESEAELSALCYEVGADAYLCLQTTTTRTFLWTLARAVERHQLIGENRRLSQTERNRGQQEQGEAERLLAAQRGLVDNCRSASAAAGNAPSAALPEAVRKHYRELLRAHVIMGSGNLSAEMVALAAALAESTVPSAEILSLHVEVVEELVRGLGSRSARHIMTRADLLILELLAGLVECRRSESRR
jgi:DNA-binding NtrC family response regulator